MKRKASRMVLLVSLAVAPAFLNGCILTDLLGGAGGALGGLLGGAGAGGAANALNGQQAANRPLAPTAGTLPAAANRPAGI